MKNLLAFVAFVVLAGSAFAHTPRVVDARSVLTTMTTSGKHASAQSTAFERLVLLQHDAAAAAFASGDATLTLTNVEVPLHGTLTLDLRRTASVFDANTKFMVNTKDGGKPFPVRPIHSYAGTVVGDEDSWVTLHYSDGDLTGFIQHGTGQRTVVGRAWEHRSAKGATPHAFSDEASVPGGAALNNFFCGVDDSKLDASQIVPNMLVPSSLNKSSTQGGKKMDDMQSMPLKQISVALALREDIDSTLKLRGYTNEQTAQHFAKIVACMSQAYEQDMRARLYISYMFVYTEEDPSFFFYDGAAPGELLEEFSQSWSSSFNDVDRTVAHLYTRKKPVGGLYVGGIAYLDKMCNKAYRGGYGVSTVDLTNPDNLPGSPSSRNAFVWDVFVAAHEIGHNVGAPHTHNCYWSPPVDTCMIQSDGTDACYDNAALRRVIPGTIMSYCHLRNGSSTPLTFGPRVAERMRTWIEKAPCIVDVPNPYVNLTSPRGTDSYAGGSSMQIQWTSARVDRVNLDWSPDGGTTWNAIIGNIPAVDSQYVWTLPAVGTSRLVIRISDASDASVFATSIAQYTIDVPLEVLNPAGGERLGVGTTFSIRLKKDNTIPTVKLEYTNGNGQWQTITEGLAQAVYQWTVPDEPTNEARIRAVATNNNQIVATSNVFAIGVPVVDLRIPQEGGEICNNQANQFRWYADFVDRVRIQYSADGGTTWERAVQAITVPADQIELFSIHPSLNSVPEGTKISLRIVESVSEQVLASLNELTVVPCSVVVSVDEDAAVGVTGGMQIVRVSPNPASTQAMLWLNSARATTVEIVAIDVSGTAVTLSSTIAVQAGENTVSLPVQRLSQGTYRLVVRSAAGQVDVPLQILH